MKGGALPTAVPPGRGDTSNGPGSWLVAGTPGIPCGGMYGAALTVAGCPTGG